MPFSLLIEGFKSAENPRLEDFTDEAGCHCSTTDFSSYDCFYIFVLLLLDIIIQLLVSGGSKRKRKGKIVVDKDDETYTGLFLIHVPCSCMVLVGAYADTEAK